MNIYSLLRILAKTTKAQNLFIASKEINGIRLFKNTRDLSSIQDFYLTWLYSYDVIMKEVLIDNISKEILNDELYEDSYLLWRKDKKFKEKKLDKEQKNLKLIPGKTIKFPKKVK